MLDVFIDTSDDVFDEANNLPGNNFSTPIPNISDRIGCVKFETDFLNVPKMLYLFPNDHASTPNQLPTNYHDLWSAKVLWYNYHSQKSFVGNSFTNTNQWELHEGVRIPFGFDDFIFMIL